MPYLDLQTHRLHYRIDRNAGDKPWLTFCNSLGTDLHMWDAQAEALSDEFQILRYDRRGHGKSGAPTPPYSIEDLGGDVIALLDALGIERTHFCGLSIGGLTGQWLGIRAGMRLNRLAVCATAPKIGTSESWNMRTADVRANGLARLVPATAERWFTQDFRAANPNVVNGILDSFAATSAEGYIGCCAALAGADMRAHLVEIGHPLLAISGKDDPVCSPDNLKEITKGVKDGVHFSLPGKHLVNIESATPFNSALRHFLISENLCPDNGRSVPGRHLGVN